MNLLIIDNADGGASYDEKWKYAQIDLIGQYISSTGVISRGKTLKYDIYDFVNIAALSNNMLPFLEKKLTENDIILFPNARNPLIFLLHEYRQKNNLKFKMIGYWVTGVFDRDSNYRLTFRKNYNDVNWLSLYEKSLMKCLDYNLIPFKSLYDKFIMYHRPARNINIMQCALPFSGAIKAMKHISDQFNETKENLIIMNTSRDNIHDDKIFEVLKVRFPEYSFLKLYDLKITHNNYIKLLSRAKVLVSTNITDYSPIQILEAMALGCFPIIPKIPIYEEIFKNVSMYDTVLLKKPYINFLRNKDQIELPIIDYIENYQDHDLKEEVDRIIDSYFNSTQLKEIFCSLN